jgi:xanthine dehydrogenase small subunit
MRDYAIFYVNGRRREVRGTEVFQSLSDYLRDELRLTGTKVVCAEGDCGSCTVIVGRPHNGSIQYSGVCSCIQSLYQMDAVHVVTIEGISPDGVLTPVQEALVQHHGTQCGFCSPGFVLSIHALLESDTVLTKQRLRQGLVGNLCRCTGYEPILAAALKIDASRVRKLNQLYDSPALAAELARCDSEPVLIEAEGKVFYKPVTIADAARFKAAHDDCVIVSGGTDLGVQVNKGTRTINSFLSIVALKELRQLEVSGGEIIAGAGVPLNELETLALEAMPEYAKLFARFGSTQIKNAATLGGNIANGSPIGDSMPALFVLGAQIELAGIGGRRRVGINNFYTGYKKNVAAPGELISRVFIPLLGEGEVLKLYKVSKRHDLDISTFGAAIWIKLSGRHIEDIRIAYGGVGPMIVRLHKTESHLRGNDVSEPIFESAREIAVQEIAPISDVRGSAEYRNKLAANILLKLYFELNADIQERFAVTR